MPQPTRGDVHVNRPLTNISIAYIQSAKDFIADKVFPIVPVMKQSDLWFSYDKKFWFQTQAQLRADSSESAGSGYNLTSSNNYFCNILAVHKDVGDQIRANADSPLDMDRDATLFVTQQLLLKREKDFMAKYLVASTWTGASDFTPSVLWDVSATSNPPQDVWNLKQQIKAKTGYMPNTLVVTLDVHVALLNNAQILDRIKYTQRGVVSEDILAQVFGVDKYLVASAVQDSNPENQTNSMAFLKSKAGLLVYANPAPSILQPSGGYIFSWQGLLGAGAQGNRITTMRIEPRKCDRVEGEMAYSMNLVGADLGCYLTGLIS